MCIRHVYVAVGNITHGRPNHRRVNRLTRLRELPNCAAHHEAVVIEVTGDLRRGRDARHGSPDARPWPAQDDPQWPRQGVLLQGDGHLGACAWCATVSGRTRQTEPDRLDRVVQRRDCATKASTSPDSPACCTCAQRSNADEAIRRGVPEKALDEPALPPMLKKTGQACLYLTGSSPGARQERPDTRPQNLSFEGSMNSETQPTIALHATPSIGCFALKWSGGTMSAHRPEPPSGEAIFGHTGSSDDPADVRRPA